MNHKICLLILIFYLIFACSSKNPIPIEQWGGQTPPTFLFKSVDIPACLRNKPDSMAQMLVNYVDCANEAKQYRTYLVPPQNATSENPKGPPWIITWNAPKGYKIFLTIDGEIDGSTFNWEVKFWGIDTTTGTYYHRWVFLEADQGASDRIGGIRVYQENSTELASYYNWITFHDQFMYTFSICNGNTGRTDFEIYLYQDLTGELFKRRESNWWEYKFSWKFDGSGQWWKYDDELNVIDSGSWE